MSSCRHRTRSAEQRWPALLNADEHRVVDDLLRQRGAVDDHRVLAAGLGDQRHDRRSRAPASARSRCRDLGRSGERDAGDARDRRQSAAPTISPAPGRERSASAGTPASSRQRTACAAMSGVCSAGFATTALPAASAAATWPREDRQRKIPRRDAGEHAAAVERAACSLRRWATAARAARRNAAARRRHSSGRNRRPRAPRRSRRRASCRPRARAARRSRRAAPRSRRRRDRGSRRALRRRPRVPAVCAVRPGPRSARSTVGASASTTVPMCARRSAGSKHDARSAGRGRLSAATGIAAHRVSARVARRRVEAPPSPAGQRATRRQSCGARRRKIDRQRQRRSPARSPMRVRVRADRRRRRRSTRDGSAMRLTNDVLAPFSSSRRTR